MSDERKISVGIRDSKIVGGCNNCMEHCTEAGHVQHLVASIELRTSEFRLCKQCTRLLFVALRNLDWEAE
jgi:hypothetical protein